MDRINYDVLVPMTYGLVVAVVALTGGPIAIVAIVGAFIVAIYYAAIRRALPRPEGDSSRNRDRGAST